MCVMKVMSGMMQIILHTSENFVVVLFGELLKNYLRRTLKHLLGLGIKIVLGKSLELLKLR